MTQIRNILVLTYWSYRDALIQTYTLPYVRIIIDQLKPTQKIYLVTLEKKHLKLSKNEKRDIKLKLKNERIHLITFNYSKFGPIAMLKWCYWITVLIGMVVTRKISHIHSWCTPAGAAGYLIAKVTGKSLILDSYEPHAEAMVENGVWKPDSLAFKILFNLEKKQAQRAEHIIAAAAGMEEYMKDKFLVENTSYFVKPACVDVDLFSPANRKNEKLIRSLKLEGKTVAVYAGKFGGIYLAQEVFDFFKVASDFWGDKFHVLILSDHLQDEINTYANKAQFSLNQLTLKYVDHSQMPEYMGLADFAITPVKPVPTKRYCSPIKDGEYWALGLPVVITKNISDDSEIIKNNDIGVVLESLDLKGYQNAIVEMDKKLQGQDRSQLQDKIHKIAIRYRSFEIAENIYHRIYYCL